jgi:hypothetical protein
MAKWILNTSACGNLIELIDRWSENRMGERGVLAAAFEFKAVNAVPGDYFEFGLWRGKTFICAHRMKRRHRMEGMVLWGFDSFAGLPAIDDQNDNVWVAGEFACGEQELRTIVRRAGVRDEEFQFVPGFYEESLNEELHRKLVGRTAAIVYVDCDLYSSTICVLRFIRQYLTNGTVICFDDYYCYRASPAQGEQRAISEFLADNPQIALIPWLDYCPLGKAFIVRVNDAEIA